MHKSQNPAEGIRRQGGRGVEEKSRGEDAPLNKFVMKRAETTGDVKRSILRNKGKGNDRKSEFTKEL